MVSFIEDFDHLLRCHKQGLDMLPYIAELDDYQHVIRTKNTRMALIANHFWKSKNIYKYQKLQSAIDHAIVHNKDLQALFQTGFINNDLQIAHPEPEGVHFGEERYGKWSLDTNGRPERQCVYCGEIFNDHADLYLHLYKEMSPHFYNGQRCVQEVLRHSQYLSEKDIFIRVKNELYITYGKTNPMLHTQRCKTVLLHFIRKFKSL